VSDELLPDPEWSFMEGVEVLAAILTVQKISDQFRESVELVGASAGLLRALAEYQREHPGSGERVLEELKLFRQLREED
jgi:hypothetical protein